jgi:ABC-2 type transport system ATP-binding protein
VTVFLTSHSLDDVEKLCTSIAILRRGRLIASGTLDELRARAKGTPAEITARGLTAEVIESVRRHGDVAAVSMGDRSVCVQLGLNVDPGPVVSLLVHEGAAIEEVRRPRPTLEQVYLDLVGKEP